LQLVTPDFMCIPDKSGSEYQREYRTLYFLILAIILWINVLFWHFGWKHRVTAHTYLRHAVTASRNIKLLGLQVC
jgi:hypothetical protein